MTPAPARPAAYIRDFAALCASHGTRLYLTTGQDVTDHDTITLHAGL